LSKKRKKRRNSRRGHKVSPQQQVRRAKAAAGGSRRPPPPTNGRDDRPSAPWGSFPLVELVVLIALVLLVAGFLVQGEQGAVMIGTGVALGSLAGLELAIREHFAGYRSHTLILAGFAAAIVLAALFYFAPEGLPVTARLAIGAAVFGGVAWALTATFRNRAGVAFKLR
jgi:hypothetical protein